MVNLICPETAKHIGRQQQPITANRAFGNLETPELTIAWRRL